MTRWTANKTHDLLAGIESALRYNSYRETIKAHIFNRCRVLVAEGYANDVALAISMREQATTFHRA